MNPFKLTKVKVIFLISWILFYTFGTPLFPGCVTSEGKLPYFECLSLSLKDPVDFFGAYYFLISLMGLYFLMVLISWIYEKGKNG